MSHERGVGDKLRRRLGGGSERTKYGGSQFLTRAALRNQHLSRELQLKTDRTEFQMREKLKHNFDTLLSLQKDLAEYEEQLQAVKYLDGDLRGKIQKQWDVDMGLRECFKGYYETDQCVMDAYMPLWNANGTSRIKAIKNTNHTITSKTAPSAIKQEITRQKDLLLENDNMYGFRKYDVLSTGRCMQAFWNPFSKEDHHKKLQRECKRFSTFKTRNIPQKKRNLTFSDVVSKWRNRLNTTE